MDDPNRFKFDGDEFYLKPAAEMRHLFRRATPTPATTRCRSPSGPTSRSSSAAPSSPRSRCPRATPSRRYLRELTSRGRPGALRRPAPRRRRRPPRLRARRHRRHGLPRLLPRGVGPHPLRPRRAASGSGPGRGSAAGSLRGLLPADRRPRPHPLRPALRAVPQPGPQADARHRHGLRRALPRRDDPLRRRALRRRPRRPDHHVLHHQGPGRRARRGPGARLPVRAWATRSPSSCRRW